MSEYRRGIAPPVSPVLSPFEIGLTVPWEPCTLTFMPFALGRAAFGTGGAVSPCACADGDTIEPRSTWSSR